MRLRRRPLSVYNASPNRNSVSDQPSRKRQRKTSDQTLSDNEGNNSDIENRSSIIISDGEFGR